MYYNGDTSETNMESLEGFQLNDNTLNTIMNYRIIIAEKSKIKIVKSFVLKWSWANRFIIIIFCRPH